MAPEAPQALISGTLEQWYDSFRFSADGREASRLARVGEIEIALRRAFAAGAGAGMVELEKRRRLRH